MTADDGAPAGARRQLDRLVAFRGRGRVREILGVDDGTLTGLLDGTLDWPTDARGKFDRAWRMMELLGAPAEAPNGTPESGAPDGVDGTAEVEDPGPGPGPGGGAKPPAAGAQAAVDAGPDAVGTGELMAPRRRTETAADEPVGDLLWRARYLAVTQYLQPTRGVPRHRRLSAWAVVLRLEIDLIGRFQSPLPALWQRGEIWDADRRRQEISLRVQRLRDLGRDQEKQRLGRDQEKQRLGRDQEKQRLGRDQEKQRLGRDQEKQRLGRDQEKQRLRRLADSLLGRDQSRDELLLQQLLDDARQRAPVFPPFLLAAEPDWRELDRLVPPGPQPAGA